MERIDGKYVHKLDGRNVLISRLERAVPRSIASPRS